MPGNHLIVLYPISKKVNLLTIIIFLKEFNAIFICTLYIWERNFNVHFPLLKFSPKYTVEKNTGSSLNEDCWFSNKKFKDNCTVNSIGFGKSEIPYFRLCAFIIIGNFKCNIIAL